MKKRFIPPAVFFLLLALPAVVLAGLMLIPIVDFIYENPGSVALRARPDGRVLVTTTGLYGTGSICPPDTDACADDLQAAMSQNLQFVTDFSGAGLRG